MKVSVQVTLDVDAKAWAEEFGIEKSEVREDVKRYMESTCEEQLERIGLHAQKLGVGHWSAA